MTKVIDFYYDFGSPNAYLVEAVLPAIAKRHNAEIRRIPILLGGLFKATGNQSPMFNFAEVSGKVAYLQVELNRFVKKHDIAFQWNPHFPILTTPLMRGAVFARGKDWEVNFRDTVYRACWVDGHNMTDPDVIFDVLQSAGLPAAEIAAAIQTPEVKSALFETTQEAEGRGAFGVPTMFIGDEIYFGKDSLHDMEDALSCVG